MVTTNNNVKMDLTGETQRRFNIFDQIRGKNANNFWDVIVITAADDVQKQAFEDQIHSKLSCGELPLSPEYIVVADPPRSKIGNGGSTLVALEKLQEKFGKSFTSRKTLIIHAGGFSQRFPTASVLGKGSYSKSAQRECTTFYLAKAFTAFPTREPNFHMLEVKLASYIDFPSKIDSGGVFVCCSDTLEVYNDCGINWKFQQAGITGLAHPSSIEIGTTHGVYLLLEQSSLLVKCKKFLHKPSADQMQAVDGCILRFSDTSGMKECVATDSAFFMAPDVCNTLLNFYKRSKPLKCEIDAYGDFLQALGTEAGCSYTSNTRNVVSESASLVQTRKDLFNTLRGTQLHVVALLPNPALGEGLTSRFYHFGTSAEYLQLFTSDMHLAELAVTEPLAFCAGTPCKYTACETSSPGNQVTAQDSTNALDEVSGGLMGKIEGKKPLAHVPKITACVMNACVTVGEGSVLEYCRLREDVSIGSGCIVSGCSLPQRATVPPGTILHTVSVDVAPDSRAYVTVAFGFNDDMKLAAPRQKAPSVVTLLGTLLQNLLTNADLVFRGVEGDSVSLWRARLFPARPTMEESADATCGWVRRAAVCAKRGLQLSLPDEGVALYSMADILRCKNVSAMIDFRNLLAAEIKRTRSNADFLRL